MLCSNHKIDILQHIHLWVVYWQIDKLFQQYIHLRMKIQTILLFPFVFLFCLPVYCDDTTLSQYSFKMQGVMGNIIPHDKHVKALIQGPVTGGELSVEFQTMGDKEWHQYHHFPTIGVGTVYLDLGNTAKLGNVYALYPYLNLSLWRNDYLNLYLKGGAGASYLTKNYYNTKIDNSFVGANSAIGSPLNIYFSGGGGIQLPIRNGWSASAEYTWNHMSNGSVIVPNSGINIMNAFVGVKYFPKYQNFKFPANKEISDIQHRYTLEFIASGGRRQLYYKDNQSFSIGSLALSLFRPINNRLRMGVGIDGFYDGAFDGNTIYERTYITSNELKNKFRAGISWQNELVFGRMTAGFHFGLYMYNPLKNLEPYEDAKLQPLNKPLIYSYDIDKEDGWLYTRAALKYTITKHMFLSVGLKTHLQKAEFIEWGLGCRL